MSMFQLPKTRCNQINSLMQKFFRGTKKNASKIHWMSWAKMGRSKHMGGLGLLEVFNKALLAKKGMEIVAATRVFVSIYHKTKILSKWLPVRVSIK